jgi:Tfp pilus assembly protein PilE
MKRAALAVLTLVALTSFTLDAQRATRKAAAPAAKPPAKAAPAPRAEKRVPFAAGETLSYDVSWSSYLTAGTATMTVVEKKPSFNSTAYYIVAEGRPTPLLSKLYSVYYKMDTLLDSFTLLPQRGSVYSEEGKRHRFKTTQFDRAAKKVLFEYKSDTTVKSDFATSAVTQDALSAIYVLRVIPLKPGEKMTMPVCDNGINYKVQFDAGASEKVRTPKGDQAALKIRLSVSDDKAKSVGKNVFIWISEDERRLPVKLQADLPVGSFNLLLRDVK